ncbi:alpha/beta hydrolase [Ferrimonas kyonanensis]|uniref:alpha/beta hydrolase n=1 Tax=Ferrimonas kyonanensis TaxID=364763 RepID=UPI000424DC75|nr:alpha/beta hydrolase [Ferrimonas kyonanensis]
MSQDDFAHSVVNAQPSWQSRVFNRVLKHGFKRRMQRVGDVYRIRDIAASFDNIGMMAPMPSGVTQRAELVKGLSCNWLTPDGGREDRIILYFHGGGFCIKTPNMHTAMLAKLCKQAKVRGVMVDYRLAPEHPLPTAHDDCFAAYERVLDSGFDADKVVIAGDSAGGNLALSTLMRIRDSELPSPAGGILFSPSTNLALSAEAVLANLDRDPMLSATFLTIMKECALTRPELALDPITSPYHGRHHDLPPMMVVVGTEEVLLEDARQISAKMQASGVKVNLDIWQGMPHVFPLLHRLPEGEQALAQSARFIRQCLD